MTKLYMKHIRGCTYCLKGFKSFCSDRALNYKDFIKNGIEIGELRVALKGEKHTLVERAITLAKNEEGK